MSNEIEGKYNLELNFVGDGRLYLNRWDYKYGQDVIAEIVDGKILLTEYDELSNQSQKEITFFDYLELVKQSL